MKKFIALAGILSLLAVPTIALGQATGSTPGQQVPVDAGFEATLNNIVDWLFTILLIVAVIAILIAAFFFITSAGDPEKVKTARQFVIYALIGVVIAVLAKGLVNFVSSIVAPAAGP